MAKGRGLQGSQGWFCPLQKPPGGLCPFPSRYLPQHKAPTITQRGEMTARTPPLPPRIPPEKGAGVHTPWCCPHCNAVPVPRPRDGTSPRVPNLDTTLTPSPGGGVGRGGDAPCLPSRSLPAGVRVLGNCGGPQDFTPAEPVRKSFSWGRKKSPYQGLRWL